jgi:hypothetical protein
LQRQQQSIEVDIWGLCYRVCFREYQPPSQNLFSDDDDTSYEVEIDTRLLDETGEIDWQLIESKAQQLVKELFSNLPK